MSRKGRRDRQRGRRALDYRGMMSLDGEVLRVKAYVDHAAVSASRVATREQGAAGEVAIYDVTCTAALPVNAMESESGVTTRFDVSGSEYPTSPPAARVLSARKPFTTHVHPESGFVCLGPLWHELRGKELLAELVLRVMRAYNFEDPPTDEFGFQSGAAIYQRNVLQGRPFNPSLVFPAVPDDVFQLGEPGTRSKVTIVCGSASLPPEPRVAVAVPRASRLLVVSGGGS